MTTDDRSRFGGGAVDVMVRSDGPMSLPAASADVVVERFSLNDAVVIVAVMTATFTTSLYVAARDFLNVCAGNSSSCKFNAVC